MKIITLLRSWQAILSGRYPALSIEITRECPLACPGCYAYEPAHLGAVGPLRTVADYQGQPLIDGVLELVRKCRPLHVSIVGGEPLVRFRELNVLLPRLSEMGLDVQVVTSAVRPIPAEWAGIKGLHLIVSIDGLQPDHDRRRAPATYDRILKHIVGHTITVHCTVTHQMTTRAAYFDEFVSFWSARPEVERIWFSLFTPQVGAQDEEILTPQEREQVLSDLDRLRREFPKLYLPDEVIEGFRQPPASPADCMFARTTVNFTADLKTRISPCQFGGNPDCSQCGCIASAGLNSVGNYRLLGMLPIRTIYKASDYVGKTASRLLNNRAFDGINTPPAENILEKQ
ncbi:MAG: radical SAM protein [Acidobacteriota bacterium]|nr:radical SAM protein [Blastocatellia bacterium]MDW8238786.1 radical SAM protein [Acidobacteriota bacterium]